MKVYHLIIFYIYNIYNIYIYIYYTQNENLYKFIFSLIYTLEFLISLSPSSYSGWVFQDCLQMETSQKAPFLKLVVDTPQLKNLTHLQLSQRRCKSNINHVRHQLSSGEICIFH